ncbi:hypothetical protein ABOM_010890 [Aspergillus bombycis]|uniref:Uncharacterized protein n=1 Tax=Aspergillus bombycis TaxID=109264 RepID=A0A1F7ZM89_9EURO|nr:hypothetical protein ABOM_010890 [Aspergillus bombycis]OGM40419.1 hypothetical protein ABOM_010890 [Aspergillus bombycis]
MTSDKQTTNGPVAKPFTPSLSAAFNRSTKSPLTPKLANPGGYRTPRRLTPSEHPAASNSKPDPESVYLSANVTPRSGTRTSRRDGPTSTPNTPSTGHYSPSYISASGSTVGKRTDRSPVRTGGKLEPARTTRAKTLTTEPQRSRPNSVCGAPSNSPRFFHASDARSNPDVDNRPKPAVKPSHPTFVYANGEQEGPSEEPNTASVYKRRSTGFTRSVVGSKPPSASPRLASPRLNASSPRLSDGVGSQAGSQIGSQVGSQIGSQIGSQLGPQPGPQFGSQAGTRFDFAPQIVSHMPSPPMSHFSPKPTTSAPRHMKSSSVDSGHGTTSPREPLRPSPIIISPSDTKIDASTVASEPIPGLRPRVFSSGSAASVETHDSSLHSPAKSESGQAKDDVAISARTERKILDLEISNSSLLAINRTLEREMRKQNAELRRYRRLSRAGRLSVAPSSRSVSGASMGIMVEADESDEHEHSSVQSPEELSELSDEDSVMDEGVISPDSLAEHDARHRAQDEKKFFIDLARHQELLADSQKMNQSLKRCLGWTEELIKEAKKALEYSVHVNDIQLGGRVLAPEEIADLRESGRGLLRASDPQDLSYLPELPDSEPDSEADEATEAAAETNLDGAL